MRYMPRLLLRPLTVVLLLIVLLAAGPAGAGATTRPALRKLPGSVLPALRSAARIAPVAGSQPIDVTVSLAPRNAALLAYTAAGHGRPLTAAQLRSEFGPSPATRASVVRYMRSQGLALDQSGLLTLGFHGTAAEATRAFHVGLSTYRDPRGRLFRAPDGAVQLPATIAPAVAAVSGLDTQLRLHRLTTTPKLQPSTVTPSCSGPVQAKLKYGGYLPADLAQAYGHGTLINGGNDGTGQSIALVELSNYKHTDIPSFQSCFGLHTPVHNHLIHGGTSNTGGAIEDELDIEVANSNAPGLDSIEVYIAPNNLSFVLPMIESMVVNAAATHTYIISDSWGLCEDALPPSFAQAESVQLELAAAAGISFYAASGDSGSSACEPLVKTYTKLVVDDPASQPFATGVGGTVLHSANGADSTAWRLGGGGISSIWPQPAYQQAGILERSYDVGTKCGNPSGFCRQVPDIALDAALKTGYIMRCTAPSCPPVPWFPAGGTSAGAPLMAAITADANQYSLAHGGARTGFANPLLYSDAGMFWDITQGTNSINGSGLYKAVSGYDPATGLGSPKAGTLAFDLAAFIAPAISQDATQLQITAPLQNTTIHYGKALTFTGTLTDSGSSAISGRRVYLELREGPFIYLYHDQTDSAGVWSIRLSTALRRNLTWSVIFPGSDTEAGVNRPGHAVRVIPRLGSRASVGSAARSAPFTFKGSSTPNMFGVSVQLQVRRTLHSAWHTIAHVRVARSGGYMHAVTFTTAGAAYLRWHYSGGKTHPWMSATSPVRKVSIT
jgi:kumamolisin